MLSDHLAYIQLVVRIFYSAEISLEESTHFYLFAVGSVVYQKTLQTLSQRDLWNTHFISSQQLILFFALIIDLLKILPPTKNLRS